jgi:DNA polymerase III alpha subunit
MKYDEYGQIIYQESDIFNLLYKNITDIDDLVIEESDDIKLFLDNTTIKFKNYIKPTVSVDDFDKINQDQWFLPDEYKDFSIYQFCVDNCDTDEKLYRCVEELKLYEKLNMIPVLIMLKYIIDTLRKHNIIWGVGRGSSVSSYILYLIGVHKIDSIKYGLDYNEFLRIGE